MNNFKKFIVDVLPFLGKYLKTNRGLLPEAKDDRDDVMGASDRFDWKVLKENGDWTPEFQQIAQETQNQMDCTGHGISNIIDMLMLAKYGIKFNSSEAYINYMAGTSSTRGNSMRTVLESIRKNGIVSQDVWPEANRWKSPPQSVRDEGKLWLKQYNFGYDAVWITDKMMTEALKYSPLYVGGYAWYKKDGFYRSVGNANHCFTVLRNREDNVKYAGDSYNPLIKMLHPTFKLYYVKRIFLENKELTFNLEEIKKRIDGGKRYAIRAESNGEFYKYTDSGLEHIKDIRMIADDIAQEMKLSPENVNEMLKYLTERNKIEWLSEKQYFNLLK